MNEKELLNHFHLTEEWVENDVERLEDETQDDNLIAPVYYGHHFDHDKDEQVLVTVKMSKSLRDSLDKFAHQYHLSRSEYMRRKLAA